MTISPITSACGVPATQHEIALASELLGVTHESELNRVLPKLIKPALVALKAAVPAIGRSAPAVMKAALPILKKVLVRAIPKIRAIARTPQRASQCSEMETEFGFGGSVGTRSERAWGTTFQRTRPRTIQMSMSLRFMKAAKHAARHAAVEILRLLKGRRNVTLGTVRRVVFNALVGATRKRAPFLLPTFRAVAASLRKQPAYFGRTLPRPRLGRLFGVDEPVALPQKPAYFGRTLPTVKSRVLGSPPRRPTRAARRIDRERVTAGMHR